MQKSEVSLSWVATDNTNTWLVSQINSYHTVAAMSHGASQQINPGIAAQGMCSSSPAVLLAVSKLVTVSYQRLEANWTPLCLTAVIQH